jgi:hypothetical protein
MKRNGWKWSATEETITNREDIRMKRTGHATQKDATAGIIPLKEESAMKD